MRGGDALNRLGGPAVRGVLGAPRAAGGMVAGAGKELAWLAAHVALYPAGLLADHDVVEDPRHRLDTLSPVSRGLILGDIEAHGTPIVLVHGLVDNRSAFALLRRTLRRRGFGRITTVNYSPVTADIRTAAARLGRHIERVCAQTGYENVHIVGHSLGGIVARYYVQRLAGDHRVDTLVTLGSPHRGTQLARLFPLFAARQLRPGSSVMAELAAPLSTICRTRFVSVWSDRDEIVTPNRSAELVHAGLDVTSVRVHGVGHLALLVDYGAVQAVLTALTGASPAEEPRWDLDRASVRTQPATGPVAAVTRLDQGLRRAERLSYGSVTVSGLDAAGAGWGASYRPQ